MTVHITACPRNCYSTCSMRVHVENGRLVRIDFATGERKVVAGPGAPPGERIRVR